MFISIDFDDCSNGYVSMTYENTLRIFWQYDLQFYVDDSEMMRSMSDGCSYVEFKAHRRPAKLVGYRDRQDAVRNLAIDWQHNVSDKPMSWSDVADWQAFFELAGKRYGLLREFRENGIC